MTVIQIWVLSALGVIGIILFALVGIRDALISVLSGITMCWMTMYYLFPDVEYDERTVIWVWGALCGILIERALRALEDRKHAQTVDPGNPGGFKPSPSIATATQHLDGEEHRTESGVHEGGVGR